MGKLLHIEWLKLKSYRPFWFFLGIYTAIVVFGFLAAKKISFAFFEGAGILEFGENWHWITYLAGIANVFLCFMFILLVTNEFQYRTLRQNVIDGLKRNEILFSKLLVVLIISLYSTFLLLGLGMIFGYLYSSTKETEVILSGIHFIPLHLLKLICYGSMALLFSFVIQRAAPAILAFIAYIPLEWLFKKMLGWEVMELLPLSTLANSIPPPFQTTLDNMVGATSTETDYLLIGSFLLFYILLFNFLSLFRLNYRSL